MPTGTDPSDAQLARRARRGDRDAFTALYERHAPALHDFLARLTRSDADAADLMQEAFLAAMDRLPALRDPARFRSWLFTIAYRRAIDHLGAARRTVPVAAAPDGRPEAANPLLAELDPDRWHDPETATGAAEVAALVWEAAAGLDPANYALLDLHLRQGLSTAETAEVLDVSPNTASQRLRRLRASVEGAILTSVLARRHRRDCARLDAILHGAHLPLTPRLRREVDQHVADCDGCRMRRRAAVAPLQVLAALAAVEVPPETLAAARSRLEAAWPGRGLRRRRRLRRTLAAAAVLAAVLVPAGALQRDALRAPPGDPAGLAIVPPTPGAGRVPAGGLADVPLGQPAAAPSATRPAAGTTPAGSEGAAGGGASSPAGSRSLPQPRATAAPLVLPAPTGPPSPPAASTSTPSSPAPGTGVAPPAATASPTGTASPTAPPATRSPSPTASPRPRMLTVTITSPSDGAGVVARERDDAGPYAEVRLAAKVDHDTPERLTYHWWSDLDGLVSTARSGTAHLHAPRCEPVTHVLTLDVSDAAGRTGTDQVSVTIRPVC